MNVPTKSNRRPYVLATAGLIITFAALYAWRSMRAEEAKPPSHDAIPVSTTIAQLRPLSDELEAVGTLEAVREVTLAPDTAGRVTALKFTAGQIVQAGATLVQLYDAPEVADRTAAQARAEFSRLQLSRSEALAKSGAVSRELLEQRRAEADQASAAVQQLDARIQQKVVRAPFSGQLGIRQIDLGQYLNAGDPVATLTQLSPLYVNFTIPQQELARISIGSEVKIRVDAAPDHVFSAEVSSIEPRINSDTRNASIQATISSDAELLKSGMYATVKLTLPGKAQGLVVPLTAIQTSASGDSVAIVENVNDDGVGTWRSLPVVVGRQIGEDVVLVSGANSGDRIVVAGQNRLQPNVPVRVSTPKTEPSSTNRAGDTPPEALL